MDRQESIKIMNMKEVYTTPLLLENAVGEEEDEDKDEINTKEQEVNRFLGSFDLLEKTEFIVELLKKHPDTLQAHFYELVPLLVSYADFWQRFFYRCDEMRIDKSIKNELSKLKRLDAQASTSANSVVGVTPRKTDIKQVVRKLETNRIESTKILKTLKENKKALAICKKMLDKSRERLAILVLKNDTIYPNVEKSVCDREVKIDFYSAPNVLKTTIGNKENKENNETSTEAASPTFITAIIKIDISNLAKVAPLQTIAQWGGWLNWLL